MSALFDSGRQGFLEGAIAWLSDTVKMMLVNHATYNPSVSTDNFIGPYGTGTGSFTAGAPATLTDTAANFQLSVIGRYVTIKGATTGGNDGTFLITARPSATQIQYTNGAAASEAFAGGTVYGIDAYFSDLPSGARVGNSGGSTRASMPSLASKTSAAGVADAADATFTTVTAGAALASIVLFKDSGADDTSRLIAKIDSGTGLPVTPNGGDITVAWDSGANKIFKL
jgi:hypothetical protein